MGSDIKKGVLGTPFFQKSNLKFDFKSV